jgi:hypothetical protein
VYAGKIRKSQTQCSHEENNNVELARLDRRNGEKMSIQIVTGIHYREKKEKNEKAGSSMN